MTFTKKKCAICNSEIIWKCISQQRKRDKNENHQFIQEYIVETGIKKIS